jgi:serine/threonine-protein kinase
MGTSLFRPGDRCGDNEVVALIGAGGFAQVYEVTDPTGARRALKIIDTDDGARDKLEARLAQGAALAMIEHVNVVRLYDAGLHGDRVFLLLELIQGRTLREALAAGSRPSMETVVRWMRQACEGVAEAHRIGAIHRDLKPENLLVTDGDVVKVIDFGIAKLLKWGMKTTAEQQIGTALYMAPEQIDGRPADPRMDVYAAGMILYEALAGAHPIVQGPATLVEICTRQIGHRPPPIREVAPAVPADLGALVDRAIEKDPARRVQTMREMADGLHAALRGLGAARVASVHGLLPVPSPFADTAELPPGAPPSERPATVVTQPVGEAPDARSAPAHLGPTVPLPSAIPSQETGEPPGRQERQEEKTPGVATTGSVGAKPLPENLGALAVRPRNAGVVVVIVIAIVLGVGGGVAAAVRASSWIHHRGAPG